MYKKVSPPHLYSRKNAQATKTGRKISKGKKEEKKFHFHPYKQKQDHFLAVYKLKEKGERRKEMQS